MNLLEKVETLENLQAKAEEHLNDSVLKDYLIEEDNGVEKCVICDKCVTEKDR